MIYVLDRLRVDDYDRWKSLFDADDPRRRAAGEINYRIERDIFDPNFITIVFKWDSLEHARTYFELKKLRRGQHEDEVSNPVETVYLKRAA